MFNTRVQSNNTYL